LFCFQCLEKSSQLLHCPSSLFYSYSWYDFIRSTTFVEFFTGVLNTSVRINSNPFVMLRFFNSHSQTNEVSSTLIPLLKLQLWFFYHRGQEQLLNTKSFFDTNIGDIETKLLKVR
jgi:hypothetical protein